MTPRGLIPTAALLLWVPFSLILFMTLKPQKAALLTIFGGLLFLPEAVSLKAPSLPAFTKATIPYLCVILGCLLRSPGRVLKPPRDRWVTLFSIALVAGGVATAFTNKDLLIYGVWHKTELPGLNFNDGMAIGLDRFVNVAIPFFVGGAIIRNSRDLRDLLAFLGAAGVVYSLFALIEVRMSPQMHLWIYGYYQNLTFNTAIRFGGFRPTVFMAQGLAVALFFAVAAISTAGLGRERRIFSMRARTVAIYLAIVLLLCKSAAAIVYGVVGLLLVAAASAKLRRRAAAVLALVVLLYPILRATDIFPTTTIVSASQIFGADRVGSLVYRLTNEEVLLAKARERPWFGWGGYNRSNTFDKMGNPSSVTDGEWIIALGLQGAVGFALQFGLLLLPIFIAARRMRGADQADQALMATLCLVVAITAVDLLPNALFSNYPYFLSGALLSVSRSLLEPQVAPSEEVPAAVGYHWVTNER